MHQGCIYLIKNTEKLELSLLIKFNLVMVGLKFSASLRQSSVDMIVQKSF